MSIVPSFIRAGSIGEEDPEPIYEPAPNEEPIYAPEETPLPILPILVPEEVPV